jgi:hypothetical protein
METGLARLQTHGNSRHEIGSSSKEKKKHITAITVYGREYGIHRSLRNNHAAWSSPGTNQTRTTDDWSPLRLVASSSILQLIAWIDASLQKILSFSAAQSFEL